MTTQRFDATPTPNEAMSLDEISTENVKEAWKDYEAKPEYKKFNKHDLIESMQLSSEETEQSEENINEKKRSE
ncbi:MAG: NF038105 family protein [Acinetobacter sp.]|mgnify:FL=1|uniref:NF038105 family protein n=1 Tax=Acinetobacter albensis TaxID=1673609 RepID=A0ABW9JS41_9GAMM